MSKLFGLVMLVFGLVLLSWIGYNFLIEMQPEAQGRNPLIPFILSVILIVVGAKRFMAR